MKTESKRYPKILRSKIESMIFFPDNIKQIWKEGENGAKESFYEYDLIRIPDKGQQIKDYELFKKENYSELRRNSYGDWRDQLNMMQEEGFDSWSVFCDEIKIKYPKTVLKI